MPSVAAEPGSKADRPGIEGKWTWYHPNVLAATPGFAFRPTLATSTETGYLVVGPMYGSYMDWSIDLPSAVVGCRLGQPSYAPKVNGTILFEVILTGTCTLPETQNVYRPLWQASYASAHGAASVRAGHARGEGVF